MKRRGPAVVAAAINLALAAAALSWPSNSEPSYKGRKLSEWLSLHNHWQFSQLLAARRAGPGVASQREIDSIEAVQTIGTNAFPCLLRWISYETPWWRTSAKRLSPKLPSFVQNSRLNRWLCDESEAEKRADLAVEGFYILGPAALPAVKELTRLDKAGKPQTMRICQTIGQSNVMRIWQMESRPWMALSYIGKRLPPADPTGSNAVTRAVAVDRPDEFWFLQK
jgi:hypothetical protein